MECLLLIPYRSYVQEYQRGNLVNIFSLQHETPRGSMGIMPGLDEVHGCCSDDKLHSSYHSSVQDVNQLYSFFHHSVQDFNQLYSFFHHSVQDVDQLHQNCHFIKNIIRFNQDSVGQLYSNQLRYQRKSCVVTLKDPIVVSLTLHPV